MARQPTKSRPKGKSTTEVQAAAPPRAPATKKGGAKAPLAGKAARRRDST